jgi:hypothetical protein
MSLLFQITPEEPSKRRKTRRPEPTPPAAAPQAATVASLPAEILGKIDDHYDCHRCGGRCHDILLEDAKDWLVGCAFCGLMSWEKAVRGHLKPKAQEFVFSDGRYAGMTVPAAAAAPNGMEYLRWAAEHHKRPTVREVCRSHLDALQSGR